MAEMQTAKFYASPENWVMNIRRRPDRGHEGMNDTGTRWPPLQPPATGEGRAIITLGGAQILQLNAGTQIILLK